MAELTFHEITRDTIPIVQYFEQQIQAGFPSPVQGSFGDTIDLNQELIDNPAATFCARVIGNSMVEDGINPGDILIIDRSLKAGDGSLAVCYIDGDFTVKRISVRGNALFLVPANNNFPEIRVPDESNFVVWGVVSHIIKQVYK